MLFRRREKLGFWAKMRTLWPRRSWSRSLRYLQKRVLRLRATPHAIAAGFAAGIFASFTPFVGFHILLGVAIAYLVAGNMAAVLIACGLFGNPLTFPAIWASTYEVGRYILNAETIDGEAPVGLGHALEHMDLTAIWEPILKPMLVGSLPIGLAVSLIGYGVIYFAARSFQRRRASRMLLRAHHNEAVRPVGTPEEAL